MLESNLDFNFKEIKMDITINQLLFVMLFTLSLALTLIFMIRKRIARLYVISSDDWLFHLTGYWRAEWHIKQDFLSFHHISKNLSFFALSTFKDDMRDLEVMGYVLKEEIPGSNKKFQYKITRYGIDRLIEKNLNINSTS